MKNKSVLITGSSSGLGYDLCKTFLDSGWKVYGISRSESKLPISEVVCDFKNLELLRESIAKLEIKSIDTIILNAGTLGNLSKQSEITIEEYMDVFTINVLSNKIILDYVLDELKVNVKNVIGISSGASRKTYYGWGLYCISKASFNQLISSYSDEYTNTHFISISPGPMKTKMQDIIQNTNDSEIPSVRRFHKLYFDMNSSLEVAKEIYRNLSFINRYKSGIFIELKEIKSNDAENDIL